MTLMNIVFSMLAVYIVCLMIGFFLFWKVAPLPKVDEHPQQRFWVGLARFSSWAVIAPLLIAIVTTYLIFSILQ